VGKYFDADVLIKGDIKEFDIRRFWFLNPKLGGYGAYSIEITIEFDLLDINNGIIESHEVSPGKVSEKDFKMLFF
jgi:hypothetical protein